MSPKFLKLGPTPGDDFEMQLFVLDQEVWFARLHLQIARGLAKTTTDKPALLHCAPIFFGLTFRAHLESAYSRAARLFDPRAGTTTVPGLVDAADMKAGKFQFADAPEVRSKIASWRIRISTTKPELEKLHDLRNSLIAHLDGEVILNPQEMSKTVNVTFDEVERILDAAKDVVESALAAYNGAFYSQKLSADDYLNLVRMLERANTLGL